MIHISDTMMLQKIIEVQSCIIEGKTVRSILHRNKTFFLRYCGADTIVLYLHQDDKVRPEYIFSEDRRFEQTIGEYIKKKGDFKWRKFIENCDMHFAQGHDYERVTGLYDAFRGYMSRKNAEKFNKTLGIESASFFPIRAFDEKEIIGYCAFFFSSNKTEEKDKLRALRVLFQTILRPLYDQRYNTVYSKCIRIDEEMARLTPKERQIVKKLFAGMSNEAISKHLHISINTLKTHLKNIYFKYNVKSKIELFHKLHIAS